MLNLSSLSDSGQSRGLLSWLWISAVVVAIDQLTKWMAEASLTHGVPVEVFPHLNMTLAYNYGVAFSIGSGTGDLGRWFLVILAGVVSVFIINWMRKLSKHAIWAAIALAMIVGGAIGNMIDRLLYGKVIDFIDVYFDIPFVMDNYHFATFNVADIAITLGAMILIYLSLFKHEQLE
ncbi:signal peptidase II [Thiolinea disciformis]|uniref:signal peptidase II n=1 Tax=Thiolinea disciformis TaxID=125614 RepID=UPI0003771C73|nr:signal peptidase II [Thiolinea disciformis]